MVTITESRTISASAEDVYAVFADYQEAHPAILPRPFFTGLSVKQGGYGNGTVISVGTKAMGVERIAEFVVHEVEPGRVLVESDTSRDLQTRFIVMPIDENHAHVTISTEFETKPGLEGFMEKLFSPRLLRPIYREELQLLQEYLTASPR